MALKWRHAGQACITANRLYVQDGIYDKFASMLKERTSSLKIGHGMKPDTTLGPVTTPNGLDKATALVDDAKKRGGDIILGGKRVAGLSGYFFEPTIVKNAHAEMLIIREENFAPVLGLIRFQDEDEVVQLANDTSVSYFFPSV